MNNVFMIWFGDEMPETRKNSIEQFEKVSETNVVLITDENVGDYILDSEPLHPAFQYLSLVHRADYLRTYLMNFHGGAYSDVKPTTGSWLESFEKLNDSDDKWAIGYREINKRAVCFPTGNKRFRKCWHQLIGVCAFICKPQTDFTKCWYNQMISLLDEKHKELEAHPARPHVANDRADLPTSHTRYPMYWNEMLGRIFHPLSYEYRNKLLKTLPKPIFKDYK